MGLDAKGTLWCAFARQDNAALTTDLRLSGARASGGQLVRHRAAYRHARRRKQPAAQRAADPHPRRHGPGRLGRGEDPLETRKDTDALTAAWPTQTIFVSTAGDTDLWSSHCSLIDDTQNNLHLITPNAKKPLYFRYDYASQVLEAPVALPLASGGGYVQASRAGNSIVLLAKDNSEQLVYRSDDFGRSFTVPWRMKHTGVNGEFTLPLMESPPVWQSPKAVVQQYVSGSTQRLLSFGVPVN